MNAVSIFNDVIGPVMRGPSSSHCAAALRIGRLARDLMDGNIEEVLVEFDRSGSLPTTHESQGSDMGLFGGLLGWEADDERLPDSGTALAEAGISVRIETVDVGDPHPNTYRLILSNTSQQHELVAISTGGGMIEVIEVDRIPVSICGDYQETLIAIQTESDSQVQKLDQWLNENLNGEAVITHPFNDQWLIQIKGSEFLSGSLVSGLGSFGSVTWVKQLNCVLPVRSHRGMKVPFTNCTEMLQIVGDQEIPLWKLAVEYEMARGKLSEPEIIEKMVSIVRILRRSIEIGITGTHYDDRVLGHQSGQFQQLLQANRLLDGGAVNRIILYVTALMEVKSSMGVIVAAPTAGACAALPGAVIAMAEVLNLSEEEMAKAMLAAGLIGVFITSQWTFAAEVGGCQAEGGSAACMAAAALVGLAGGSLRQSIAASSMAFQSMLGLICDPIANRVEAPCLGKNVMAASNAFCCANMALSQFDPLIPLDEVIEAAKNVSSMMPREHRCTSLGGLATTPTSLEIERKLNSNKQKSCGSGCGCAPALPLAELR